MTVVINGIEDLTAETVVRVAWEGERCELGAAAIEAIRWRRKEFEAFVTENRDQRLYGITTRHHVGAKTLLDAEARAEFARRLPSTPATIGTPLPERLVRTIVLTRLSDVLNGTACLRPDTAERLVRMLDTTLPPVFATGNGEPGDIIALGQLFRGHFDGTLQIGEGMALINGSPVAAAALCDAVLSGGPRVHTVERALALGATAARAPAAHFSAELGALWKDPHQEASLRVVRELTERADRSAELPHQAPVSFRSGPRLAGWMRRAQATAEECVAIVLTASSNNPVFVGPRESPPHGAILSNGGYHNPMVSAVLDSLARAWADMAQLITAQVNRLVEDPAGLARTEPEAQISLLHMTSAGWAEEARAAVGTPSLTGLGCAGQTDTSTVDLLAWRKATAAGVALDNTAAILSIVAAHTAAARGLDIPPGLSDMHNAVLAALPVDTAPLDFADRIAKVVDIAHRAGRSPDSTTRANIHPVTLR
ncbi:aromatic amino acid lyase [Kutzneria sp. NPDC052558]|uniref:aromatic amino acid lyase n=1 Tax=Kutzneria sp. NPDC052558 TaxID=3364121 RepID=UPI0037C832C4